MMNEHGKSDGFKVPEKSPNKARPMAAEGMEGRNPTKGNPSQQNTSRTQRRADVNNALERVRAVARGNKEARFTALFHHIYDPTMLATQPEFLAIMAASSISCWPTSTRSVAGRWIACRPSKQLSQILHVLLISAYDRQTLRERHAQLLTTHEFLPLPFEFPHLTETIETLLQLQATPPCQPQQMGGEGTIGRTPWPN